MSVETQGFRSYCAAFQIHRKGTGLEVEQLGHEPVPTGDVSVIGKR